MVAVSNITLTHRHVPNKGFEKSIAIPNDFAEVHHWGSNEKDGDIFLVNNDGRSEVFKGFFHDTKESYYGSVSTNLKKFYL